MMRLRPAGSLEGGGGVLLGRLGELEDEEIHIDPSFTLHFDVQTRKLSFEQTLTLTPERLSFTLYLIIKVISGFCVSSAEKVTLQRLT